MKATSQPTDYILTHAYCNSDWDECQFALIHCTAECKNQIKLRLQTLKNIENEIGFASLNFYDTSVDFYRTDEDEQPYIHALLGEKDWTFVELDEDKQEKYLIPENRLDTYRISLYRNGTAQFTANGKNTNEEFWTSEFSVLDILNRHQQTVKIIQLY